MGKSKSKNDDVLDITKALAVSAEEAMNDQSIIPFLGTKTNKTLTKPIWRMYQRIQSKPLLTVF